MMELENLNRGQGMQDLNFNSRNENMKGTLDETGQYECHKGQLPTQTLMNPKNVCPIDSSMALFIGDYDESVIEISSNVDDWRGRE